MAAIEKDYPSRFTTLGRIEKDFHSRFATGIIIERDFSSKFCIGPFVEGKFHSRFSTQLQMDEIEYPSRFRVYDAILGRILL